MIVFCKCFFNIILHIFNTYFYIFSLITKNIPINFFGYILCQFALIFISNTYKSLVNSIFNFYYIKFNNG